MHELNAHVRNGRLVLDEPTDLPEGQVVKLVPLEHASGSDADAVNFEDDLDDEELAALNREIDASFDDEAAGKVIDAASSLADLRSLR